MRKVCKFIFLFAIAATVLNPPLYAQNKVGTSAAPFLGIAVGARAQALGGAYLGTANDVTAAYWNPGALVTIGRTEARVSHSTWILGTDFNWVGINIQLDDANAIGLSITQLDYGSEEITTIFEQEGSGRFWEALDLSFALSYSRKLTDRFSMGGSFKLISQQIWNESASTFAIDLGLVYQTGYEGLRLGMAISNFGGKMRLDGKDLLKQIDIDPENNGGNKTLVARMKTDDWPLPIFFRLGIALDVLKTEENRLTALVDALHPTDNVESVNVGAEYSWNEMVALRIGYKSLFQEDSEEGLTVGGGVQYDIPSFGTVGLDYAYVTFGVLEDIQTFDLSVRF